MKERSLLAALSFILSASFKVFFTFIKASLYTFNLDIIASAVA